MQLYDLSGAWQCAIPGAAAMVHLPGTLDTNGVGFADTGANQWHPDASSNAGLITDGGPIATRLTRRHTYEGPAVFSRRLRFVLPEGKRAFLECERSRHLRLRINGQEIAPFVPQSVSTPHLFEITQALTGDDLIELTCDNSYPGWPRGDIVYSSAATDETQTNWNGLLGKLRIRVEEPVFLHALRVYPKGHTLDVRAVVCADRRWSGEIRVHSDALVSPAMLEASGGRGMTEIRLRGLPLRENAARWDEDEGNLHTLTAEFGGEAASVRFGIRDFRAENGRLTLNGRAFFLRGEANCAVFPITGHPPMDKDAWLRILKTYRSYGVNCMRFHSHCPPEAAFDAADELGMLMQPELSHWNPKNAFSSAESRAYYTAELEQMLAMLANHPSFVMLSLGNELHADEEGHAFAARLLHRARALDSTRLYANASNGHYGQRGVDDASDFYTADSFYAHRLRATSSPMAGWLNERYPDLRTDYADAIRAIREAHSQPVFGFEVGQYEVLPDFEQLEGYTGVTQPENLRLIEDKARALGLLPRWKQYVEATGELSLLCYRAEAEACLRTQGMSGLSLLGLQDFPGQGTALVGMLDSLLRPKPYAFAQPESFARFFTGTLPLALLPRMTYVGGKTLDVQLRMANYGKKPLTGVPEWTLTGGALRLSGSLEETSAPCGGLAELGRLRIALPKVQRAQKLTLFLRYAGYENDYALWLYPDERLTCPDDVYECRTLDERALHLLRQGGTVYLAPDSTQEALPRSVRGQFSTDFWSVGTFPAQPGGMGQLIDAAHPIFEHFPTDAHTDWQWWPMAGSRAVVLPAPIRAIVTLMDSYAYMRPMAQLFECRCAGGRVLFSSMGLHHLLQYPEARALQSAIYRYLADPRFAPEQTLSSETLRSLLT